MKSVRGVLVLIISVGFLFFGCAGVPRNPGSALEETGSRTYGMPEFQQKDLGDFSGKISETHKEQLIRESLKEKYVSGVSYPYEYVYHHQYSLVKQDGSTVEYTDYAVRVNTPNALKDVGEQLISFQASRETVEILKALVYSPDGREIRTDISSVREKEPYTGLVYSALKIKSISLKGLDEGSIFRVVLRRIDRPGGRKSPIFKEIGLTNYLPAKERVYLLRFQAGTDYAKKERIRGEVSESVVAKSRVTDNGDTLHIYAVTGGKTEIPEPGSIPVQEYDDRVFFFTPSTWGEVAKRYYSLSSPKVTMTEEISQKAKLLSKDFAGKAEKIKAIYNYVRGVRYVAILLNQHEIVPHEAILTLRNGYGDCKDKSVLLIAMLKAIGIDSSIALVNTTHLIDKDLSSLSVFNHAIVALPGANGTYSFMDATNPHTPYGLLPPFIQKRHALVVGEKGGELVTIPTQGPEKDRGEVKFEIDFHDAESATIATKSTALSANEIYHTVREFPEPVIRQLMQASLSQKYKEVEILSLKLDPADKEGVLRSEKKVKIRDFAKRMGNTYAFNPLVGVETMMRRDVTAMAERKTDIELEGPSTQIDDVTIRLPALVTVEFIPKSMSFKNDKFGEYSYQISQTGNTIHLRRELRMLAKRISMKDYKEFRDFYRTCIRQEEEMVLLKRK